MTKKLQPQSLRLLTALTCLIALLYGSSLSAADGDIFRAIAEDGSVTFSDHATPGAKSIELSPTQTMPVLVDTNRPTAAVTTSDNPEPGYQTLKIIAPLNDTNLRENAGLVVIRYASQPPINIQRGHRLRIFLDASPIEAAIAGMSVTLNNVDRGQHELQATITDDHGKTLIQSRKTHFNLSRFSKLFKRQARP